MAKKVWQTIKVQHCQHAGKEVMLEAEIVLPDEHLSGEAPRIVGHRCSQGLECGLTEGANCVWSGANPTYDPFAEKQPDPRK